MRGVHGRKVISWIGCGFGEMGGKYAYFNLALKCVGIFLMNRISRTCYLYSPRLPH